MLENAYYISNIVLTLSIVIALATSLFNVSTFNKNLQRKKSIESLKILEVFHKELIPKIDKFNEKLRLVMESDEKSIELLTNEEKNLIRKSQLEEEDIAANLILKLYREAYIRLEIGAADILNQLEHLCSFVEFGVCEEKIIVDSVASLVVKFKRDNDAILLVSENSDDSGDFKSLLSCCKKWEKHIHNKNTQKKIDYLIKKQSELESGKFTE